MARHTGSCFYATVRAIGIQERDRYTSATDLVALIVRWAYIFIAVAALFEYGRHRDQLRLDIALMLSSLAVLKLPKVDGIEVLKRIKGDERTRYIPVVVMTSSREERDVVQSYQLRVNSYIVKPSTSPSLRKPSAS